MWRSKLLLFIDTIVAFYPIINFFPFQEDDDHDSGTESDEENVDDFEEGNLIFIIIESYETLQQLIHRLNSEQKK